MSDEELATVLTQPVLIAFRNLRYAGDVRSHPGYVWARRSDVDMLLAEVTVSVGIEVDLEAAKAVIARLEDMLAKNPDHLDVRKVRALMTAYYPDGLPDS